jgi:hypothetical protein
VYIVPVSDAYVEVLTTRGRFVSAESRSPPDDLDLYRLCDSLHLDCATEKHYEGVHVHLAPTPRIPDVSVSARYKNFHWADLTRGQLEALDAGADLAVLCGVTGNLSEGPGFNVFFVRHGKIFTPAANVLAGITRMTVMDLARELALRWKREIILPMPSAQPTTRFSVQPLVESCRLRRLMEKLLATANPDRSVGDCENSIGQNENRGGWGQRCMT